MPRPLALALLLLLAALGSLAVARPPAAIPSSWSAAEHRAAGRVSAAGLLGHVRFLASDLLEGRAPGTRGGELAMAYVASEFERLGLAPLGDDGGFLQRFDLVGMRSEVAAPPTLRGPGGSLTLRPPEDAIVGSGVQQAGARIDDAEVVFVGYGITAPEQRWDDWKDVDVRGKVLLVMNSDPEGDPALFAGKTRLYYGRWSYKFEEAARRHAAGVILIHTTPSAGYPWQVVQSSWDREQFELPAGDEPRIQVKMWVTEDAARRLAALGKADLDELRARAERRDFRPVPLGVKLSVALSTRLSRARTANVLGLLPPSGGPAREMVVYSAHHDHLGIGRDKSGDVIYNGALDNASGVAAMLSVADAAVAAPPRHRALLFAAVGAEEAGLLGSQYLCTHPPVPAGRIAANINFDGINVHGVTTDVELIGLGRSTLDDVVVGAARQQGRTVKPDQFPERGHFYRSDQFNFARIGVPVVYLKGGTDVVGHGPEWGRARVEDYVREHYHQPSDQMDATWDLGGAVDDVRLALVTGLRIAAAAALPTWRPGDEFQAARNQALSAP